MRGTALWIGGAILAFAITAGAFLLLANLAPGSSTENLTPDASSGKPGPALDLNLNEDHLAALEMQPGQILDITVENAGSRYLSDINLTLGIFSADTANPETLYYRQTITKLAAGKTTEVRFQFDLSDPGQATTVSTPAPGTEPDKILEIRAATPEGVSAIKTAILPAN